MRLNLPFELKDRTVLIAGAGGGWDIFGGLPLAHEISRTCRVVLANYSSSAAGFDVSPAQPDHHPEFHLARILNQTVHVFGCGGARPLRTGYERVLNAENIDCVILVDGGVDSLMRGDEEGPGSILQDTLSLLVVHDLQVPVKILACIGLGTETEEGVCHYRALENMAALTKGGSFLGSCALTEKMEAFRHYETVSRAVFEQPGTRSHIHTRIIPAVHGEFGRVEMYQDADACLDLLSERPPFVCPLMPVYWFFDVAGVARRNLLLEHLRDTETYEEVQAAHERLYPHLTANLRKNRSIPL